MTNGEELYLVKQALTYVKAAGGVGILETTLMQTVRGIDGNVLDAEQRESIWTMLVARGWINWHFEPILHVKRWTLTDSGITALESL